MGVGNRPIWVQVERSPAWGLVWRVRDWWWSDVDDADNDGTLNVHSILADSIGQAALSATAIQHNGGTTRLRTDQNQEGKADAMFAMYPPGSNFDPSQGERGPFSITVEGLGAVGSDVISGIGTIGNRHTQYHVIWQLSNVIEPAPPPPTGDYVSREEYDQLLMKLADTLDGLSRALGVLGELCTNSADAIRSLKL